VRTILVLSLSCTLTLCPFLCMAAEAGHGGRRHQAADGSIAGILAPVQGPEDGDDCCPEGDDQSCPDEGDNCVCKGAVQSAGARVPGPNDSTFALPCGWFFLPADTPPHHLLSHLTLDGLPTGLAGWGDSRSVRALLQNFRC
jgi:hypothetical protein